MISVAFLLQVVVSDPSTVDDLKAEIERVYSALFPSSR